MNIYNQSFSTCVGEDIEHANKALSQASYSWTSRCTQNYHFHLILISQPTSLDRSYRLSGVMKEEEADLKEDVSSPISADSWTMIKGSYFT